MMKKASVNKCNINSDNVYDNSSGINFTEVYAEYNYSPLTNQYTVIENEKKYNDEESIKMKMFG